MEDLGESLSARSADDPDWNGTPAHPAYLVYTSGTTGQPKGALISHRAIVNHMLWMQDRFPMRTGEAVLQKTPSSFDASIWEFFR